MADLEKNVAIKDVLSDISLSWEDLILGCRSGNIQGVDLASKRFKYISEEEAKLLRERYPKKNADKSWEERVIDFYKSQHRKFIPLDEVSYWTGIDVKNLVLYCKMGIIRTVESPGNFAVSFPEGFRDSLGQRTQWYKNNYVPDFSCPYPKE